MLSINIDFGLLSSAIGETPPILKPVNSLHSSAAADECKEFTGFSIGGVSPIALDNKPKSIFIDNNLSKYKKVFAAAGHPYVVFGLSYLELCDITNGIEDNITE